MSKSPSISLQPLSKENWKDFEGLFGEKGACGGCWCMLYRLSKADFENGKANFGNRERMKELVFSGKHTGILAYDGKTAIGWAAFSPREDFIKLERSRVHKRIDDKEVWSIPCLFIAKGYRKKGVSAAILSALAEYSREKGIKIMEAYPEIAPGGKLPDTFAWMGIFSSFEKAGFTIADRTSKNRPTVRRYIE